MLHRLVSIVAVVMAVTLLACPGDDSMGLDLTSDLSPPDLPVPPPDAPAPDLRPPDLRRPDLPCTCIPVSAWTGWISKNCSCFQFNWGCKERPQKWSWCDVHFTCMFTDTDPATGCPRPRIKTTGCNSCSVSDISLPDISLVH